MQVLVLQQGHSRDNILQPPAAGDFCWLQKGAKGQHQPSPRAEITALTMSALMSTSHQGGLILLLATSQAHAKLQAGPGGKDSQTLLLPGSHSTGEQRCAELTGGSRAVCNTSHFTQRV